MNRTAPLTHAAQVTKPLLVFHGKKDPLVPWSESKQMVDAVRKNGTPVWFVSSEEAGHGYANDAEEDYVFYIQVLFMKKYLLK